MNIDFPFLQKHAEPHVCAKDTHKHLHTDSRRLRSCSPLCPHHLPARLTSASTEQILMDFQVKITIPIPLLCRSQQSLIKEAAVGGSNIRCLSSPMLGWWIGVTATPLHVNENLLYQPGRSVVPSVSPPTLLWQHAPHFCLICSLLLLFRPLLIRPYPLVYLQLLSFTSFNTASAQKKKKRQLSDVGAILVYFTGLWIFSVNSCFFCSAVKSHVCLLEGEFIWYVGSLNNSELPWH